MCPERQNKMPLDLSRLLLCFSETMPHSGSKRHGAFLGDHINTEQESLVGFPDVILKKSYGSSPEPVTA